MFKNRKCIGTIDLKTNKYNWLTFEQVGNYSRKLANGLKSIIKKERSFIGIYLPNCNEWIISDIACSLNHFITVGFHLTYSKFDLINVINNADISSIICLKEHLEYLIEISKSCPLLENLIVVDLKESYKSIENLKILKMEDLMKNSNLFDFKDEIPIKKLKYSPNDLFTIVFTRFNK
jgi:long-chain acyl-CoA synthetase